MPAYFLFPTIAKNAFSLWKSAFKREMTRINRDFHDQPAAEHNAALVQLAAQNLAAM